MSSLKYLHSLNHRVDLSLFGYVYLKSVLLWFSRGDRGLLLYRCLRLYHFRLRALAAYVGWHYTIRSAPSWCLYLFLFPTLGTELLHSKQVWLLWILCAPLLAFDWSQLVLCCWSFCWRLQYWCRFRVLFLLRLRPGAEAWKNTCHLKIIQIEKSMDSRSVPFWLLPQCVDEESSAY